MGPYMSDPSFILLGPHAYSPGIRASVVSYFALLSSPSLCMDCQSSPSAFSVPSVPVIPKELGVRADQSSFAGTANALAGAVKYSESAGGFCYLESGKLFAVTRNRFIHW